MTKSSAVVRCAWALMLPLLAAVAAAAEKDVLVSNSAEHRTLLAVDATNTDRLAIGSLDDPAVCASQTSVHVSSDRGRTWRTACLPMPRWSSLDEPPSVVFDAGGDLVAMAPYYDTMGSGSRVSAHRSTDGGATWSVIGEAFRPYFGGDGFVADVFLSHDAGTKSPYRGRLYATMIDSARNDPTRLVRLAVSTDNGARWSVQRASPFYDAFDQGLVDAPALAIGRQGALYLSYRLCTNVDEYPFCLSTPFDVMLVSSSDGGVTWSTPRRVQQMVAAPVDHGDLGLPNTRSTIEYRPMLAADASAAAFGGRLYSVVSSYTAGRLQIMLSRSDDGGAQWSEPVPVSPVAGVHDQFMPSVSVNDLGQVAVGWLDRRNDSGNVKYQPVAAVSVDGGQSFSAPVVLDRQMTDLNKAGGAYRLDGFASTVWSGRRLSTAFLGAGTGDAKGRLTLRFTGVRP
jgi:hypothetical protein